MNESKRGSDGRFISKKKLQATVAGESNTPPNAAGMGEDVRVGRQEQQKTNGQVSKVVSTPGKQKTKFADCKEAVKCYDLIYSHAVSMTVAGQEFQAIRNTRALTDKEKENLHRHIGHHAVAMEFNIQCLRVLIKKHNLTFGDATAESFWKPFNAHRLDMWLMLSDDEMIAQDNKKLEDQKQ